MGGQNNKDIPQICIEPCEGNHNLPAFFHGHLSPGQLFGFQGYDWRGTLRFKEEDGSFKGPFTDNSPINVSGSGTKFRKVRDNFLDDNPHLYQLYIDGVDPSERTLRLVVEPNGTKIEQEEWPVFRLYGKKDPPNEIELDSVCLVKAYTSQVKKPKSINLHHAFRCSGNEVGAKPEDANPKLPVKLKIWEGRNGAGEDKFEEIPGLDNDRSVYFYKVEKATKDDKLPWNKFATWKCFLKDLTCATCCQSGGTDQVMLLLEGDGGNPGGENGDS